MGSAEVAGRGRRGYSPRMSVRVNLADPAYEPSDEDLTGLMHEAFAGLPEAHEQSLLEMRTRIATLQRKARVDFNTRRRTARAGWCG